jgi:Peptidase family C25/Secretion system C-terminal sorting domain
MKGFIILFVFFAFQTTFSQTVTLRDTTNQYDYIIITVPEFVSASIPFKEHKKAVRGFNTIIVDTAQIFAEFDSSDTPQDNIRDFISYAGTFWKEPQPKYFLLVGNRSKLPNYDDIFDFGNYLDTAHTDYKFSVNKYSTDGNYSSFQIGRVPAYSTEDVEKYFNKASNYEVDSIHSSWMNNNLFVEQYYPDSLFSQWVPDVTNSIMDQYPEYFTNYFFTENENSPNFGNRDSILNFLNTEGAAALWLIGNTSNTQFGNNSILDTGDVKEFSNNPKNFITFFFTRQFFSTDNNTQGLADRMLLDDNASVAVVSPVGLVFVSLNNLLYQSLVLNLFDLDRKSLGSAINESRNQALDDYTKRMLNLWGDPSLIPKFDIPTSVEEDNVIPTEFVLYQSYPNPFNPSTKIKFVIPKSSFVNLKVYNVLGKETATLVNEQRPAGTYEVEFNAVNLPSGVYFYKLQAGSFVETKKMVLLR